MERRTFLQSAVAAAAAVPWAAAAEAPSLIIDTHQHLWDLERFKLPWLSGAPEVLRHTYHLAEYREAARGLNVRCVYMEVNVAPEQQVAEAEHVLAIARDGNPTIAAVIGCQPQSEQLAGYLDRFRQVRELRGLRRVLHDPDMPPGYCLDARMIKNLRLLGERGLSFDLCMRPGELGDGAKLAAECPDTRLIVDHCGNADPAAFMAAPPSGAKPAHDADGWKRSVERLAARPNVLMKISGIIARLPSGGDASLLAPIVNHCLDAFGPDRVVFGSDWPVCLLGGSLAAWVRMLGQIIATRPAAEQQKLWSGNALRHYGLTV